MKAIALILGVAVGASAAVNGFWINTYYLLTKAGPEFRVSSACCDSLVAVKVKATSETELDYTFTREEAASLGHALLEAAGESKPSEYQGPTCDEFKGYIKIMERAIADPETSDAKAKAFADEITWARTRIQSLALDKRCFQ